MEQLSEINHNQSLTAFYEQPLHVLSNRHRLSERQGLLALNSCLRMVVVKEQNICVCVCACEVSVFDTLKYAEY